MVFYVSRHFTVRTTVRMLSGGTVVGSTHLPAALGMCMPGSAPWHPCPLPRLRNATQHYPVAAYIGHIHSVHVLHITGSMWCINMYHVVAVVVVYVHLPTALGTGRPGSQRDGIHIACMQYGLTHCHWCSHAQRLLDTIALYSIIHIVSGHSTSGVHASQRDILLHKVRLYGSTGLPTALGASMTGSVLDILAL